MTAHINSFALSITLGTGNPGIGHIGGHPSIQKGPSIIVGKTTKTPIQK
jgi:hypothetical protein